MIKTRLFLFAVALFSASVAIAAPMQAGAVTAADWQAGRIIDDGIFTYGDAMSVGDIQNFLNAKVGVNQTNSIAGQCDTNGTRQSEYGGGTRAQWGALHSAPAPYTCLKDYYEVPKTTPGPGIPANNYGGQPIPQGAISAAQIIYNAAHQYNINPRVLLTVLQKESAGPLITDAWPTASQYLHPMGAHCPDSSRCDSNYYGFSMQMYESARLFRSYLDGMDQSWWGCTDSGGHKIQCPANQQGGADPGGSYKVPFTTDFILYNTDRSCGGATINIQSKATAALYMYTPYQPNAAALNNMYGGGDTCSSFGNRNFWRMYSDWFGSTTIPSELLNRYTELSSSSTPMGAPTSDGFCVDAAHSACWEGFQNGYIVYSKNTGAWESYGAIRTRWSQLGYQNGSMGFPSGPIYCTLANSGCYQQYQNGFIVGSPSTGWWESAGSIRAKWGALGFQDGKMGYPTGGINPAANGGYYQQYQNGFIVGNNSAGYWESMNGPIRDRWGALGFQNGRLGYPTNAPDCTTQPNSGCIQTFQGGTVYWTAATGAWAVWGGIGAQYAQLGTNSGSLGYPTGGESCNLKNGGCYQAYQNGYIVGSPATGWRVSTGTIRDKWGALGFQDGRLGYPTDNPDCSQPNSGCKQDFQGGTVFWTSATGAWQTWGAIGGRYAQLGTDTSSLGYPVAAEVCGAIKNNGCFQLYQNGYIVGSPATGWWESTGGIRTRWGQLGYENGQLGYPTGAQACILRDGGCFQLYQNGYIVGTAATGYWESFGPIRSKWAALGYQDGAPGYPTGAVTCASGTCSQTYEHGTIFSNQSTTWYTP